MELSTTTKTSSYQKYETQVPENSPSLKFWKAQGEATALDKIHSSFQEMLKQRIQVSKQTPEEKMFAERAVFAVPKHFLNHLDDQEPICDFSLEELCKEADTDKIAQMLSSYRKTDALKELFLKAFEKAPYYSRFQIAGMLLERGLGFYLGRKNREEPVDLKKLEGVLTSLENDAPLRKFLNQYLILTAEGQFRKEIPEIELQETIQGAFLKLKDIVSQDKIEDIERLNESLAAALLESFCSVLETALKENPFNASLKMLSGIALGRKSPLEKLKSLEKKIAEIKQGFPHKANLKETLNLKAAPIDFKDKEKAQALRPQFFSLQEKIYHLKLPRAYLATLEEAYMNRNLNALEELSDVIAYEEYLQFVCSLSESESALFRDFDQTLRKETPSPKQKIEKTVSFIRENKKDYSKQMLFLLKHPEEEKLIAKEIEITDPVQKAILLVKQTPDPDKQSVLKTYLDQSNALFTQILGALEKEGYSPSLLAAYDLLSSLSYSQQASLLAPEVSLRIDSKKLKEFEEWFQKEPKNSALKRLFQENNFESLEGFLSEKVQRIEDYKRVLCTLLEGKQAFTNINCSFKSTIGLKWSALENLGETIVQASSYQKFIKNHFFIQIKSLSEESWLRLFFSHWWAIQDQIKVLAPNQQVMAGQDLLVFAVGVLQKIARELNLPGHFIQELERALAIMDLEKISSLATSLSLFQYQKAASEALGLSWNQEKKPTKQEMDRLMKNVEKSDLPSSVKIKLSEILSGEDLSYQIEEHLNGLLTELGEETKGSQVEKWFSMESAFKERSIFGRALCEICDAPEHLLSCLEAALLSRNASYLSYTLHNICYVFFETTLSKMEESEEKQELLKVCKRSDCSVEGKLSILKEMLKQERFQDFSSYVVSNPSFLWKQNFSEFYKHHKQFIKAYCSYKETVYRSKEEEKKVNSLQYQRFMTLLDQKGLIKGKVFSTFEEAFLLFNAFEEFAAETKKQIQKNEEFDPKKKKFLLEEVQKATETFNFSTLDFIPQVGLSPNVESHFHLVWEMGDVSAIIEDLKAQLLKCTTNTEFEKCYQTFHGQLCQSTARNFNASILERLWSSPDLRPCFRYIMKQGKDIPLKSGLDCIGKIIDLGEIKGNPGLYFDQAFQILSTDIMQTSHREFENDGAKRAQLNEVRRYLNSFENTPVKNFLTKMGCLDRILGDFHDLSVKCLLDHLQLILWPFLESMITNKTKKAKCFIAIDNLDVERLDTLLSDQDLEEFDSLVENIEDLILPSELKEDPSMIDRFIARSEADAAVNSIQRQAFIKQYIKEVFPSIFYKQMMIFIESPDLHPQIKKLPYFDICKNPQLIMTLASTNASDLLEEMAEKFVYLLYYDIAMEHKIKPFLPDLNQSAKENRKKLESLLLADTSLDKDLKDKLLFPLRGDMFFYKFNMEQGINALWFTNQQKLLGSKTNLMLDREFNFPEELACLTQELMCKIDELGMPQNYKRLIGFAYLARYQKFFEWMIEKVNQYQSKKAAAS
jgi:hypothetical protein